MGESQWAMPFARRVPATQRHVLQAVLDTLATAVSIVVALFLRFEFEVPAAELRTALPVIQMAVVAQLVIGSSSGLYSGRWRFGGFEEFVAVGRTVLISVVLVSLVNGFAFERRVPISVTLVYGMVSLLLMGLLRSLWRLAYERRIRPTDDDASSVLVFGAGEAGAQVVASMLRNPTSPYVPVGLLDDDRSKRSLRIMGVPVMGTREHVVTAAHRTGAEALVIAIPSTDATLLRDLSSRAAEAGIKVMGLPPVQELFGTAVGVADIRPITETDLLGRRAVDTDIDSVAGYLTGRRVLVTGAGGSIGSELCRQIYRYAPLQLVMLDRDESALHEVQLALEGRALLDSRNLVVADIRDAEGLDRVFAEHQPEVVFHAAALKHLPLLEMYPAEAVKVNCWGTRNVLNAAMAHGVERFVNISTDKAANPCSVLGYSKRIAERITAAAAYRSTGTFLSVRFGNVLGSRGSVLTAFRSQIEAGGPVTVTHPDVTRFFMTIEEAVQLVVQAGAIGDDGQALVLDMGEPVLIADVARRLIAESPRPIDVVYTGLRPGEKLCEVLLSDGEVDVRPEHPLVSHVEVPGLDAEHLEAIDLSFPDAEIVAWLRRLCDHDVVKQVTLDVTLDD